MKFLKEYSQFNVGYVVNESIDNKRVVDQIIETMLDLIEDGYNIKFLSPGKSGITYQQYLDGQLIQSQFKLSSGVLVSQFTIRFTKNEKFKSFIIKFCAVSKHFSLRKRT